MSKICGTSHSAYKTIITNKYIIYYMDDIILAEKVPQDLLLCYRNLQQELFDKGFQIATEKNANSGSL